MVLLQEKKANMINGTVNNDQVALDKLTPEDMQFLFRGSWDMYHYNLSW